MSASGAPLRLVPKPRAPEVQAARRIEALATLPVFLKIAGRRAVVAGGSEAALWKAELLAAAGAHVDVYARDTSELFETLATDPPSGSVAVHARGWAPRDLAGAAIAIADAVDDDEARAFAAAARAVGIPFNIVDKPDFCELQFGAIVNRSPLVISISTDGAAPVFAQALRAKIEALIPHPFMHWAHAARAWRPAIQRLGLSFALRRRFWEAFSAKALSTPGTAPTDELRDRLLSETTADRGRREGRVTLVGAGPGDPDLLTLKAVRALQSADIILHDDLVAPEVLDYARREAKRVLVGKTGHGPACKQGDINALMLQLAQRGRHVVRLKGGDPGIFGRAAEEIEACRRAGIEVSIVPGITAAQGAAASLGLSLTRRGQARRLQFVTGHASDGEVPDDLDWAALADPSTTTAVYMPRKTLSAFRDRALASGLLPHVPAIAISAATRHNQRSIVSTVSRLPELVARLDPPGPLLVLIGAALTEMASEQDRTADAPQRPFVAGDRA